MRNKDEIRGLLYAYREFVKFKTPKKYTDKNGNKGIKINLNPSKEIYRLAILDLETKEKHRTSITTKDHITSMLWHYERLWVADTSGILQSSGERINNPANQLITLEGRLYAHNGKELFDVDTGNIIISEKECKSVDANNILAIVPYKKGLLVLATTPYEKYNLSYNTLEYFLINKTKNTWKIKHLAQHLNSGKRDYPFWHDVGPQHKPLMININNFILSTSGWCDGRVFVQDNVTKKPILEVQVKDCVNFLAYDQTRKRLLVRTTDKNYYFHNVKIKGESIFIDSETSREFDLLDYKENQSSVSFLYITKSQMDDILAQHPQDPVQKTLW